MKLKALSLLIICAFFASVVSCSPEPDEKEVTNVESVTLDCHEYQLSPTETLQLQVTVKYVGAKTITGGLPGMNQPSQNKQVTWSSDNPEVATVSDSGLVTAVSEGEATIKAETGGKEDSCRITVTGGSEPDPGPEDPPAPDPELHPAVDLGLSVKWASFNIGSADIGYLGTLYSFGDVKPRNESDTQAYTDYPWGTYDPSRYRFNYTKYIPEDGLQKLEPADDAATFNWGEGWWTPTKSEWAEFRDRTVVRFYVNDLFYCAVYTSTVNGKSIILPALPKKNAPELWKEYMSSTPYNVGDMREAYMFTQSFKYLSSSYDYDNRTYMYSVRAVTDGPANEAELTPVSADIKPGATLKLSASGFGPEIYWRSTDPSVAVVSQDGTVTAKDLGDALIFATDGVNAFAGSMITVISAEQSVDLGLSVNWGGWNLGASDSGEIGDYFAWGESAPDPDGWYDGEHYKYCESYTDEYNIVFSKYLVSSSPVYLSIEDDAAAEQWGNGWRMPSDVEIQELVDNTARSLVYMHGLRGIRLTGPSGKSIFMPTAGGMEGQDIYQYGFHGLDDFIYWRHFNVGTYWSNRLSPKNMYSRYGYTLVLAIEELSSASKGAMLSDENRVHGFPVRAVHNK